MRIPRELGGLCFVLLAVTLLTSLAVNAQPPADAPAGPEAKTKKAPWNWTLEERAAALRDPVQKQERVAAYKARNNIDGLPADYDWIVGRENPALFLPCHMLRIFMEDVFSPDSLRRETTRLYYAEQYEGSLKMDEEFWRDLSIIAAGLLAAEVEAQKELDALQQAINSGEDAEAVDAVRTRYREAWSRTCRPRAETLAKARDHFGREEFDRILYEAVAPKISNAGRFTPEALRKMLWRERGCVGAP